MKASLSRFTRLAGLLPILAISTAPCVAAAAPSALQKFTIKDYLRHNWADEIVHFPFEFKGRAPKSLTLTGADGRAVPTQITGLTAKGGKVSGNAWTVLTLAPKTSQTFTLSPGASAPTGLRLQREGNEYWLGNERLTLRLPKLAGALPQPVALSAFPAPLLAIGDPDAKTWLGQGSWTSDDPALRVKTATTTIVEEGPISVKLRYRLTFTDDRFYQADISLGARQDAAMFADATDIDAPKTAFRFSFGPGLGADRVFWRNNYYAKNLKGLKPEPINFEKEQVITKICPWAFWWLEDQTTYAGFYRNGAEPFVSVIARRPSRWSPVGWTGFDRTVIPVTARPGGELDITLALLAQTEKAPVAAAKPGAAELPASAAVRPAGIARRELAFSLGTATENLTEEPPKVKLRHQLTKYSEFPLDEVKDFAFDFKRTNANRKHPYLLFTQADIDRARRLAQTVPALKADLEKSTKYMASLGVADPVAKISKQPDGWLKYYKENYVGNGLYDHAPQAYVGSADPQYGIILAAGVKGLAREHLSLFLENPYPASLGASGHMAGTTMLRLLLAYDAIADSGYLTAEDKEEVESALVFGGYVFDHKDYWNDEVGLMSANPNMTSLLRLPLGLVGIYLDGHPRSEHWLKFAEGELKEELKNWIAPGGAWLECPMYQAPSLDGMFLLAQALKNVKGRDYFSDPQFKATMDYYGFILTAPDLRFPSLKTTGLRAPMTVPSIGDAFPAFTHPFNGWIARETAKTDPAFSARQQFFWKGQGYSALNGGRAGFITAVTDADLPAAPPAELARKFEGFGNIMRTSWTDTKASYVSHRNGYFNHHYDPGDANSIIYYAKGAPLCMDFGHRGASYDEVIKMWKPDYHNGVKFNRNTPEGSWGMNGGPMETNRAAQDVRTLPATIDYSTGVSVGSGGQTNNRHLLLVKSADQMGATYLLMRDVTTDAQPNQEFTWNLWCMATDPEIQGNQAHFPGQFGVDLDAHVLSPANPKLIPDKYSYRQWVNPWGFFDEAQTSIHVQKAGSTEDFFAVLFPRAEGQAAATVTSLAGGRAAKVTHMEGTDLVLLSPGKPAEGQDGDASVKGEMAFARRYLDGSVRLAVLKDGAASIAGWSISSPGPVSLEVKAAGITGESSGEAHTALITVPANSGVTTTKLDGKTFPAARAGDVLTLQLPSGAHTFAVIRDGM